MAFVSRLILKEECILMHIKIKEIYKPTFIKNKIIFGFQEESIEIENDPDIAALISLIIHGCSITYLYEQSTITRQDIDEIISALDSFGLLETIEDQLMPNELKNRYKTNLQYFTNYTTLQTSKYDFQKKLNEATVFLIGTGGSIQTAMNLAGMGIGKFILLDCDTIELGNLNRQLFYCEEDIGTKKTVAAKRALQGINKNILVDTVDMRVEDASCLASYVEQSDIIINAIDTPPIHAARWVNYACMQQNKPLLQGGISPQAVVVDFFSKSEGCYDCYLLNAMKQDHDFIQQLKTLDEQAPEALDFNTSFAPNISLLAWALATETGKRLAHYSEPLVVNKSLRINVNTLEKKWINDHHKIAECPSCNRYSKNPNPVTLKALLNIVEEIV